MLANEQLGRWFYSIYALAMQAFLTCSIALMNE